MEELSPCSDRLLVTVTPVNGVEMDNYGTSNRVEVHLYEGIK
jgi:hypothetical protein